jgi:hypothetical protein
LPNSFRVTATAERLAAFAAAVGAPARAEAAPTFMTVCREGEFRIFQEQGIPLSRILHAEQAYRYEEPIRAGDELEYATALTHSAEKASRSGKLRFLTLETAVTILRGGARLPAGSARTTVVAR